MGVAFFLRAAEAGEAVEVGLSLAVDGLLDDVAYVTVDHRGLIVTAGSRDGSLVADALACLAPERLLPCCCFLLQMR